MLRLILYGTAGCHLCDLAEACLAPRLTQAMSCELVDIAENDQLMADYGVRIPVLRCVDDGAELGWPFDGAAVIAWLRARRRAEVSE